MGVMDRVNRLDAKLGGDLMRPVSDPGRRLAKIRELRDARWGPRVPMVLLQELVYLRERVDALDAQVQSLASESGP